MRARNGKKEDMEMENTREAYVSPELEMIEIGKEDVILTSGCIIVSSSVSWEDGSGNRYTTQGTGF